MDIFSARVKWLREKRGLSQKETAEVIGMSPPGYGKVENGQREPSLEKLVAISGVLNERSDFLLGITHFDKQLTIHVHYFGSLKNSIKRIEDLIEKYMSKPYLLENDVDFFTKNTEALEYTIDRYYELQNTIVTYLKEIPFVPDDIIKKYQNAKHDDESSEDILFL